MSGFDPSAFVEREILAVRSHSLATFKPPAEAPRAAENCEEPARPDQILATLATFQEWERKAHAFAAYPRPAWMIQSAWDVLRNDVLLFVDEWGQKADEAGWTEIELFACYKQPWLRRLDHNGVLVGIDGRRVVDLDPESITIEEAYSILRFRKYNDLTNASLIWRAFA